MEAAIAAIIALSLLFHPGKAAPNAEPVANPTEFNAQYAAVNTTMATELLESLPSPEKKVNLAVYALADKTGQYKENGGITNSRAVTQGATEMLVTALVRSNQFRVLDRLDFQHILNEHNLKNQKLAAPGTGPELNSLLGADYILEGAITEYDVDRRTGGLGLKVAGAGFSDEYARATCALDLRLTHTTTGEVVWAKSLKKEIYGRKTGLTVFTFMDKNIVEFETGRGMQETINLVVRSLIEEAVYALITDLGITPAAVELAAVELKATETTP